ncbi:MAG: bacterioferritin [Limisphaerales bacterium]|jgi:bacterioferritin
MVIESFRISAIFKGVTFRAAQAALLTKYNNMKGNPEVIAILNSLLADELAAISQYMVHSEMCEDWGYSKLHKVIEERAFAEMRHAENLIKRILFLGGTPTVTRPSPIVIGEDIVEQLKNDLKAEEEAIVAYNKAVRQIAQLSDAGSRSLVAHTLRDEEDHLDWIETQLGLIEQLSLPTYLSKQL